MFNETKEKISLLKTVLVFLLFLAILVTNIIGIKFAERKILEKNEKIKNLETQIKSASKETQILNSLTPFLKSIEKETGRNLIALGSEYKQKEKRDLGEIKRVLEKDLQTKNWQIEKIEIKEDKLFLTLNFPLTDLNSFLNYLEKELLIFKIASLKIEKATNNYKIEIVIK